MTKRKATILAITYLAAFAVGFGIFSAVESTKGGAYRSTAVYGYEHAFGELVGAVTQLDDALRRASYATGSEMSASVCADIYGNCLAAEMTLAALPFSTQELEQTAGFAGVAGDYAAYLLRSAAEDGLDDTARSNFAALAGISGQLRAALTELQNDVDAGAVLLDDPENVFADHSHDKLLSAVMLAFEEQFPELPQLDYDGQYSSAAAVAAYDERITQSDAKKAAAKFFGLDESALSLAFDSENGSRGFSFEGGTVTVDAEGRALSLSSSRPVAGDMTDADLETLAERFLRERGFEQMEKTASVRSDSVLRLSYAPRVNGILYEQARLGISMAADDGSVYAFDAADYYSHCGQQSDATQVLSEAAASKAVPQALTIRTASLVAAGTPGGSTRLCYEFDCLDPDGEQVRIFVDAHSGRQCRIIV